MRRYSCSLDISCSTPNPRTGVYHVQLLTKQSGVLLRSLSASQFTNALLSQGRLDLSPNLVRPHAARLLRHFESSTIKSMSYGTVPQQAWCVAIPDLVLKHNFVLRGVLAVTALHLSTSLEHADAQDEYRNLAAAELNAGLAQYITEVRRVTSDNTEALFAFSTAISLFASFQATTECENLLGSIHLNSTQKTITRAVQTISRGLRTLRGVKVILVPGWAKLRDGPLRSVVQRESWSAANSIAEIHLDKDRRLQGLESMWSNQHRSYHDYFDTLRQAWQHLRGSFALVWRLIDTSSSDPSNIGPSFDWTSIFHWPVQCSLEFIFLLEQQCIEAWVLLAHYAILQAEVKGLWWLKSSATNIVTTAALIIGTNNWGWITWPAANIGVDLESLRPFALTRARIYP